MKIQSDYIERLYAGWLGKLIGVRLGAPIENFKHDTIKRLCGNVDGYVIDYGEKLFATDDDTNGPTFFIRALEDYRCSYDLTSEEIGRTWLNYPPKENGFYWWGGYGVSTEHTAYLNLRSGVKAPDSGSARRNGKDVAEQIGGQIFIDPWGLVNPGNPDGAANLATKAAGVSHDGDGINGGVFIATAIAAAFTEQSIAEVITCALKYIPKNSEYYRVVTAVLDFYDNDKEKSWEKCLKFLHDNFGYDRYPGVCHIIPNSGVIVLSLIYGGGDFSKTMSICANCGWDTDCNAGNVGTIIGVFCGLDAIDYKKWRKPINDTYLCASVIGSLNIVDVTEFVAKLARFAYTLAKEEPPARYKDFVEGNLPKFNFMLPQSTHGFRVRQYGLNNTVRLYNDTSESHSGNASLRATAVRMRLSKGNNDLELYYKTNYRPEDLYDGREGPRFSPLIYPSQTFEGYVKTNEKDVIIVARCFCNDMNGTKRYCGQAVTLTENWQKISLEIPYLSGSCINEIGVVYGVVYGSSQAIDVYFDDFDITGKAHYTLDFSKEKIQKWSFENQEIGQMSRLNGNWKLENGVLVARCYDFAECYTGFAGWKNYHVTAHMAAQQGQDVALNFRVKGAIHSYCVKLAQNNKLQLCKNNMGYTVLAETDFIWSTNTYYEVSVRAIENEFTAYADKKEVLCAVDDNDPYLKGCIGFSLQNGSVLEVSKLTVEEL